MIPVNQIIKNEETGDCFRACVCSIFEWKINDVPNFMEDGKDGWYDNLRRFFDKHGITLIDINVHKSDDVEELLNNTWSIGSGISPRGEHRHAVVCYEGKIVHDPYGEESTPVEEIDLHTVFIMSNPDKWMGGG